MNRSELIESLRWKKFNLGSDGFICLVDVMGDDASVVQAARVSFGQDARDGNELTGSVSKSERDLIRYLMCHRHSTPLEMAELKFLVRVPMDCWRQWIRHRTASVNEVSTRYREVEAEDAFATTLPGDWRLQSTNNKQGSSGDKLDLQQGNFLSEREALLHTFAMRTYQDRIERGVAKEQARKDLPLSTYTEAYWKIDLHNLLHFLGLRMDSHAQLEIREYATTIGLDIVKPLFPVVWEAFCDYRLDATTFSGPEMKALAAMMRQLPKSWTSLLPCSENKRENDEFKAKLALLGFQF